MKVATSMSDLKTKLEFPLQSLLSRNQYAKCLLLSLEYDTYEEYKETANNLIYLGETYEFFSKEFLHELKTLYKTVKEFYFEKGGDENGIPKVMLYLLAYFSQSAASSPEFRSLCVNHLLDLNIQEVEFGEMLVRLYTEMTRGEIKEMAIQLVARADIKKEFCEEALDGLMTFTALFRYPDFCMIREIYTNALRQV